MKIMPPINEMVHAYQAKDPSYDGVFLLAVRTTGVFCRPSCPARPPLPENVEYFASAREALLAGYRPCKRCRPTHTGGTPPEWVQQLLRDVEQSPAERVTDENLRSRGIDPARARRFFLKHYGLTFQAFCRARRLGQAFKQIRQGGDADSAAVNTGYESASGFRDAFARTFGLPPGRSRGTDCVLLCWIESPLGPLVAGATSEGVCLLEFSDRRMLEAQLQTLRRRLSAPLVPGDNDHLQRLRSELADYFAGTLRRFTAPLTYSGTPFQELVWRALLDIPYGETRSYEELARAIGAPTACRAVGRANGLNRVAILIPCHRVVNKDGRLCGYGGGLWRKRYLLELERTAVTSSLSAPARVADRNVCPTKLTTRLRTGRLAPVSNLV